MMSQDPNVPLARLSDLAEFRFQLRTFLSFSESASEAVGIAAQQYQLMQVIASTPQGQQPSISYLAERMILRHNSTVELVDRAERAGLVRRENDERDLRRSLVQLTPARNDHAGTPGGTARKGTGVTRRSDHYGIATSAGEHTG